MNIDFVSLKTKLIGIIVIALIVALSVSSFLIYINSQKALADNTEHTVALLAESSSKEIRLWLDEKESFISSLANNPLIRDGEKEAVSTYLTAEIKRLDQYETLFVINTNGDYYSCTRDNNGNIVRKGDNVRERPYFIEAMKGKTVISNPLLSKDTGNPVVVAAVPIKRDDKIIGVMGGAISIKEAIQRVSAVKVAQTGYAFVLQGDGLAIMHPDKNTAMKHNFANDKDIDPNLQKAVKQMMQGNSGIARYSWNKVEKYIGYAPVKGVNWSLAICVPVVEVNQQLATVKMISWITPLMIAAIISIITGLFLTTTITRPIQQIIDSIKNSNNDLTKRIDISTSDEIGELAKWFNNYTENLRRIIGMVSGVADNIHTYSATISSTMEQQSGFATQLSSSVVEISTTMEEFSSTATQIAQHSGNVVGQADKTLIDTRHGAHEVENLTAKFNDISLDLRSNLDEIVELGRKSKEINKIMEIIGNIANQTKLIAFNAALEAASAGEAGKRFGVVAVEIRRLADSVVVSTGEIEAKITEILDSVNRLVMSSDKSSLVIQEGQEYAGRTVSLLANVVGSVEDTTDAAHQISLSIQQQQIASGQVVIALKDIEQGVRYSTDSIRTASEVTGELAELSNKLRSLIMTFKLEDENMPGATALSGMDS